MARVESSVVPDEAALATTLAADMPAEATEAQARGRLL
jgi:hypothetical protein